MKVSHIEERWVAQVVNLVVGNEVRLEKKGHS